ncbi:Methylase of polypeptide chain release factors [Liberibacter crescens BT-1]|uniref:peptide chain release factor N(5)-glutamine methyltransferase n=2 Tax=Liberibacter crescens TaxID=1273132 RepID=L0EUD2_LIBCB|nr:Methylase of polypeptide chain release factors [Liberibacter crescens BT-1]
MVSVGRFLEAAGFNNGMIEARILLSSLTGFSLAQIIGCPDTVLEDKFLSVLEEAIYRRLKREPIYRILGWCEFYGLRLFLSPETLEPRPETELLVSNVLPYLQRIISRKGFARILDLGTGTGAICLALLKECPLSEGVGVDISFQALKFAKKNAIINNVQDRFSVIKSNWFSRVKGCFDVIVSNPPYIASNLIETLEPEVRKFDPLIALDGGLDGLYHYRIIADSVVKHLEKDGICAVEIGYNQKVDVLHVFENHKLSLLQNIQDYGKKDRILIFIPNISL